MSEAKIHAAVGAPPAVNNPDDVKTVQKLLLAVVPPLQTTVQINGKPDAATLTAIREFQKRFAQNPDGRVDAGGRTFESLAAHFANYVGCSARQRDLIIADVAGAKEWLGQVKRRLGSPRDEDMRGKVKNVFHFDIRGGGTDATRYFKLQLNFVVLRDSLDQDFPRECVPQESAFAAWVDLKDPQGTMHFPLNYSRKQREDRIETIIHERAHTVFKIEHDGMKGAATVDFGISPGDDNGFTTDEAFGNAYCYGWLAHALQPGYASQGDDEIIVSPHKH